MVISLPAYTAVYINAICIYSSTKIIARLTTIRLDKLLSGYTKKNCGIIGKFSFIWILLLYATNVCSRLHVADASTFLHSVWNSNPGSTCYIVHMYFTLFFFYIIEKGKRNDRYQI